MLQVASASLTVFGQFPCLYISFIPSFLFINTLPTFAPLAPHLILDQKLVTLHHQRHYQRHYQR